MTFTMCRISVFILFLKSKIFHTGITLKKELFIYNKIIFGIHFVLNGWNVLLKKRAFNFLKYFHKYSMKSGYFLKNVKFL